MSDSTYVVNCFRDRWWEGWLRKGWVNSAKKPVANRDLWEPLVALVAERGDVAFQWVKGHSGHPENERADRLACDAASRSELVVPVLRAGQVIALANYPSFTPQFIEEAKADNRTNFYIYTAKVDYVQPFKKGLKFEAGFKTSFVETDNVARYDSLINNNMQSAPVLVSTSATDYDNGMISSSMKGRGLGDCWSYEASVWDGTARPTRRLKRASRR